MDIDYDQVATRSFRYLALAGSLSLGLAAAGLISAFGEVREGLHHLYRLCLLLRIPPSLVSVPVLLVSILATTALCVWVASIILGAWKTERAKRLLRATTLPLTPQVQELGMVVGLEGRLFLVDRDEPFALTVGFICPSVVVSRGLTELLEPGEFEAVLRHERHHLERRDPLRYLIGRATRRALFFLPAITDLWERYLMASELAADVAVMMARDAAALGSALLKVLRYGSDPSRRLWVPQLGSILDIRILSLTNPEAIVIPHIRWHRLVFSMLLAVVVLGFLVLSNGHVTVETLTRLGIACTV